MFSKLALVSILATLVSAASDLDIAGLEANFKNAGLDTVFHNGFKPQALLTGSFGANAIQIGQPVAQADAGTLATLSVDPTASFNSSDKAYTAMLVDAQAVGAPETGNAQTLHWLVNGVHLTPASGGNGTEPLGLDYNGATNIREYAGPGPAAGSGAHRYMFLLYEQGSSFAAPAGYNAPIQSVDPFNLGQYVSDSKVAGLAAATYFTVENGQASVAPSATFAVDSKTLSGAAGPATSGPSIISDASNAASATGSGSAAASHTSGASGAAPAASSHASNAGKALPAVGLAAAGLAAAALF